MKLKSKLRGFLPAALVWLYAGSLLFLAPGILGHINRPGVRLARTAIAQGVTHFAIADFDGDHQPDLVMIRVTRDGARTSEYFVDLKFSSGARPSIGILGPAGGLQITPRDVNGDQSMDLVVTSLLDSQFMAILLNDGKGNFRQVERSSYPQVGKLENTQLAAPGDSTEAPVRLSPNRGTDEYESVADNYGQLAEDSVNRCIAAHSGIDSRLVLAKAGRAPPRI